MFFIFLQVLLGSSGISIKKQACERLMQDPKDGIFIRDADVQSFFTAGHMGRSVTGAASN